MLRTVIDRILEGLHRSLSWLWPTPMVGLWARRHPLFPAARPSPPLQKISTHLRRLLQPSCCRKPLTSCHHFLFKTWKWLAFADSSAPVDLLEKEAGKEEKGKLFSGVSTTPARRVTGIPTLHVKTDSTKVEYLVPQPCTVRRS